MAIVSLVAADAPNVVDVQKLMSGKSK